MTKNTLVRYDAMCRAIEAAYKVDEVKDIRDKAVALEVYARQAQNVEAEQRACQIRLRAERKAGQILAKIEKAKRPAGPGRGKVGNKASPTFDGAKTLKDQGITKRQSSDWQKLGAVPDDLFEQELASGEATTRGIIKANEAPKAKLHPEADRALWLYGRLGDFEDDGFLAADPADIMPGMRTSGMLDEVARLAPLVSAWLRRAGEVALDQQKKRGRT